MQGLKGCSKTNLKQCRLFYETYGDCKCKQIAQFNVKNIMYKPSDTLLFGEMKIGQAVPDQFQTEITLSQIIQNLYNQFPLGWTHYVTLLTIT